MKPFWTDQLPHPDDISGITPRVKLVLGPGFPREEVKDELLRQGARLSGRSVLSVEEWAKDLYRELYRREPILLLSRSRRKMLLRLCSHPALVEHLPEVRRRKSRSGFLQRVDEAVQALCLSVGRMEEIPLLEERAREFSSRKLRQEIQVLATGWLSMLSENTFDEPSLYSRVTEGLAKRFPMGLQGPGFSSSYNQKVVLLLWGRLEPRVMAFVEEVKRAMGERLVLWSAEADWTESGKKRWYSEGVSVQRWHTLDDAAESLVDHLREARTQGKRWDSQVILMSDQPDVRRSLMRALRDAKLALADPRDPGLLWESEEIKRALLFFEWQSGTRAESRGAGVSKLGRVREWQRVLFGTELGKSSAPLGERVKALKDLSEGREAGAGLAGRLLDLSPTLKSSRVSLLQVAEAHLRFLESDGLGHWILFFQQLWEKIGESEEQLGERGQKKHLLLWGKEIREALRESAPPPAEWKPEDGVRVYRVGQIPGVRHSPMDLHLFGIDPGLFSNEGPSDLAWSSRERERLAVTFGLRSGADFRTEQREGLLDWFQGAKTEGENSGVVHFYDAEFNSDGAERRTLESLLFQLMDPSQSRQTTRGSHPRWTMRRSLLPREREVRLPMQRGPVSITATELDATSRCGFLGLATRRWKLEDLRDPDWEVAPEVLGNLLHAAVKILVQSRTIERSASEKPESSELRVMFSVSVEEALKQAWSQIGKKGWMETPVLKKVMVRKCSTILNKFIEKEVAYVTRAQTQVFSLEGPPLELKTPTGSVRGIPDRIDAIVLGVEAGRGDEISIGNMKENSTGLFVIDYKTSSLLPKGSEIRELKTRLQLPFYACAIRQQLKRSVVGVQFVELNRKGGRSQGMFFPTWNGKKTGSLTQLQARNQSLLPSEVSPDEIWDEMERAIDECLQGIQIGQFDSRPRKTDECEHCRVRQACGEVRRQLRGDPHE